MSCFNGNSGNGCWIILLLLLCGGNDCGCGGGNGLFGRSGGNGNGDGCWIILLLLLCGCLGNGTSALSNDCGCGCGCN